MLIHHYDTQMIYTGESRDIGEADGAPPGWTRTPLPALSGTQVAQFQGSGWLVLADRPAAQAETSRAGAVAARWEAIKAERERRSNEGGYSILVDGVPKWFHSDAKSKTQQISLVMLGASIVAVPPWKTMDGSRVKLTPAMAGQVFGAAVAMDGALFAAADAHDTAMRASANPTAYDFSGSWPLAYGETA